MTSGDAEAKIAASSACPDSGSVEVWHAPCPGQTQTKCDLYITILRGIIQAQAQHIADLERRAQGEPLTWEFLTGVGQ